MFLLSSCLSMPLTAGWVQAIINNTSYDIDYTFFGTLGEVFKGTSLVNDTAKIDIGFSCIKEITFKPRGAVKPGPAPLTFKQPFKSAFPGCTDITYRLSTTRRNQLEVNTTKGKGFFTGNGAEFHLIGDILT